MGMVVLKRIKLYLRPSYVLGFLLLCVISLFLGFVGWEFLWPYEILGQKPPGFNKENWLFFGGVSSALSGWIITAWITVRNSIKQHTINTLLQSRLSPEYMKHATNFNNYFFNVNREKIPIVNADLIDTAKRAHIDCARYVLNYFEFMAVGIRYGDLDGDLLKDSMHWILNNSYEISEALIKKRQATNPKIYENLEWLRKHWDNT